MFATAKNRTKRHTKNRLKTKLKARLDAWFARRARPTDDTTLTQRRIYIFLSGEGWLYGALLIITFIAGINYANNLVLGLCFYLASVLVICIHVTYAQLSGLHIKLIEVADSEAEGQTLVRVQVAATGSKPHRSVRLTFLSQSNAEHGVNTKPFSTILPSVLEPQLVDFYLPVSKRGRFTIPRLTVSSVYPLGILRTWSYVYFARTAWVWPKPLSFVLSGSFEAVDNEQIASAQSKKGTDDFDKLDTYVQGEPMSRVSWRHVARGRGMLSKHFADSVGQDVLLDYANMPASSHEAKLSQLSFAVQQMSASQTPFALRLTGLNAQPNHLSLGSGQVHEKQALLMLAKAPVFANTVDMANTGRDMLQTQRNPSEVRA